MLSFKFKAMEYIIRVVPAFNNIEWVTKEGPIHNPDRGMGGGGGGGDQGEREIEQLRQQLAKGQRPLQNRFTKTAGLCLIRNCLVVQAECERLISVNRQKMDDAICKRELVLSRSVTGSIRTNHRMNKNVYSQNQLSTQSTGFWPPVNPVCQTKLNAS